MSIQQATTVHKYSKVDGVAIFLLLISPYFSYFFSEHCSCYLAFICLMTNKGDTIMKRVVGIRFIVK
jgi:hypothetical protein